MNDAFTDDSRCPRCGRTFHCGVNDPTPCPCFNLGLRAATVAALRATYTRCVCLVCLAEVDAGAAVEGPPPAP